MKSICAVLLIMGSHFVFSQEPETRGPRQIENKFAIKFTPTQMIMGELNLGIEFKVGKKISMDIEGGPTLSQVGLGGRTVADFEEGNDNITREGSIGYFAALGLRYYPFERTQALTRLYIHPQLKYRVYNTLIGEESGIWEEQMAQNTQYKFLFNIGWQLWTTRTFGFDFYIGGGLGYRQVQSFTPLTTFSDGQFNYIWEEEAINSPQLLMNFGIKLAFGG